MSQKISVQLNNLSQDDKIRLETEIEVLPGVIEANVNDNGTVWIDYDEAKTTKEKIIQSIQKLGCQIKRSAENLSEPQEHTYFVRGMHCASCEILIEKKLLDLKEIKSIDAKAGSGKVLIEYIGQKPSTHKLNQLFKQDNYVFSNTPFASNKETGKNGLMATLSALSIAAVFISVFLLLNKLGFSGLVNITSSSSFPTFFVFGLLAGVSSCAALVGGMVLSMSKQWSEIYSDRQSTMQKLSPHLMFGSGRLIFYAVFGAILGAIGSQLKISVTFSSLLIIAISALMLFLGLQMLGVKKFRKFQFTVPKFISRYVADETNFKGRYMPFIMGALTFFLPCGFTITAQGIALLSGSPWQGAMIMFAFALGTAPVLLIIGLSSIKFSSRPDWSIRFAKVAGFLVLFFAIFNINNQLNVLGYANLSDIKLFLANANTKTSISVNQSNLPQIINGKQMIKMNASASGYQPNYFTVRVNVPVRWEITDTGTSGCTNAIISKSLFDGQIPLTPGQVSVKEFTPTKTGKYKFSCWMGMVSGVMEVVDTTAANNNAQAPSVNAAGVNDQGIIPSGAKGCGCGGGNGASCGVGQNKQ